MNEGIYVREMVWGKREGGRVEGSGVVCNGRGEAGTRVKGELVEGKEGEEGKGVLSNGRREAGPRVKGN